MPADADVRHGGQRHLVDESREVHALRAERLTRGVDTLDPLEELALPGGHRVGLQQHRAVDEPARPAGGIEETAVDVMDVEVDELPAVEVGDEDQGGVVQPVGQVHQFGGVGDGSRLAEGFVAVYEGVRLQRAGAQFRQGLDLPDHLGRLRFQTGGPDDLERSVDAASGAGGNGGPSTIRELVLTDGGKSGLGQ
jgi:hypothetical protein